MSSIIERLSSSWISRLLLAVAIILLIIYLTHNDTMHVESSIVGHMYANDVLFADNCAILAGKKEISDASGVSQGLASVQIIDLLSRDTTEISLEDSINEYEDCFAVCRTATDSYWVVCTARKKEELKVSANTLWLLCIKNKKITEKHFLMEGVKCGDLVKMRCDQASNLWIAINRKERSEDSLTIIYKAAEKNEMNKVTLLSKFKLLSMDTCLGKNGKLWLLFTMKGEVSFDDKVISSKKTGVIALYRPDMSCEVVKEFPAGVVLDTIGDNEYGCYILASFPSPVLDDHVIEWCRGAAGAFYIARIDEQGDFMGGRAISAEIESASLALCEEGISISAMCYGDVSLGIERNYNITNSDAIIMHCVYDREYKVKKMEYKRYNSWNGIVGFDDRNGYICISGRNIPCIKYFKRYSGLTTILMKIKK